MLLAQIYSKSLAFLLFKLLNCLKRKNYGFELKTRNDWHIIKHTAGTCQQNSLYGHYELGTGEVHALKINFGCSFCCCCKLH